MKIQPLNRVQRSYTQRLCAEPAAVSPLLCPVREAEWLERWDPLTVITNSGAAEVDWEARLNHFLRTGGVLRGAAV